MTLKTQTVFLPPFTAKQLPPAIHKIIQASEFINALEDLADHPWMVEYTYPTVTPNALPSAVALGHTYVESPHDFPSEGDLVEINGTTVLVEKTHISPGDRSALCTVTVKLPREPDC